MRDFTVHPLPGGDFRVVPRPELFPCPSRINHPPHLQARADLPVAPPSAPSLWDALQPWLNAPPDVAHPLPVDLVDPDAPAPVGDRVPCHLFMPEVEWPIPLSPSAASHAAFMGVHGHAASEAAADGLLFPPCRVVGPPRAGLFDPGPAANDLNFEPLRGRHPLWRRVLSYLAILAVSFAAGLFLPSPWSP